MKLQIVKGSTSQIITVFIQDSSSTTGDGLGSLDQTSSIVGGFVRAGSTGVALAVDENVTTEGTYQAPSAAGKVRIGTPANMRTGTYELHLHNDLVAAGVDSVFITLGGASNMADLVIEIQLTDFDLNATGGDAPATQDQVSQIGSGGGSANNEFAILSPNGFVITTGLSEVNNEDATRAVGGDVHQISDNGGTLNVYYLFDIGGAFSPNTIVHDGRMNGNNDDVGVFVNTNTQASPTWVQRATLEGSNSSVNLRRIWPLVSSDQMVGADAGKVAVQFQATGLGGATLTTDQIIVEKTTIASVTGYQDGQVWVNTVSGTAGTVVNVNGVADKAVLTWADAIAISGSAGLADDFHIINGSTIALTGTSDNFSLFGDNWTLQLESRSVAGAYFQGAIVTGIGTSSTEVHYEGCEIGTMSVQIGHFDFCSFGGTVTMTLAGDYNYHNCYSMVAGPNGPTFTKTAGQAITAQWRNWAGSINLTGLEVGDTLTIGGSELGTIDLGSPAGAVAVEIRGIYKGLASIGSAAINLEGAINAADVSSAYAGPRGPGVYLNDAAANTNTVDGHDGTLSNAVSTMAAAKTITDSLGFKRVYLINDSSATLTATMEDYEFIGIGEMMANTINFGSQDVDNSAFHNLLLTGAQGGTGRCQTVGCVLSVITGMEITASGCVLADAGVLTLRDDCAFDACFSAVAGSGTPTLDINSVASVNAYFRHYSGGLRINNAVATTVMSFEADGQLIVDATCTSLTIVVRGNCSITDNGTTTDLTQDAAVNRTNINAEVDTALVDIKLDHLIAVADGDDPVDGSIMAHLVSATEDWSTFVPSTDSLQAIRDRGDAEWDTATGFNTVVPDAAGTAASLHGTTDAAIAAVKTDTGNLITRIPAALFSGITSLAQWLGLLAGKQAGDATARTELRATGVGSGTFDETTDSEEATVDRGNVAWTTGAGGDATEAKQDTIIVAIGTPVALDSGAATLGGMLTKMADDNAGADFDAGTDSLQELRDKVDTLSALSGGGAFTGTLTIDDGATGLQGVVVNALLGGVLQATGTTDVNGQITDWAFDANTFDLASQISGYQPSTDTLTVSADAWTKTISLTLIAITAPPNASTTTGVMKTYDEEQALESGVEIHVQILDGPDIDGISYDSTVWTETSDGSGIVQFAGIVHGARYKQWRGDSKADAVTFVAPTTGTSFDMAEVIGRG